MNPMLNPRQLFQLALLVLTMHMTVGCPEEEITAPPRRTNSATASQGSGVTSTPTASPNLSGGMTDTVSGMPAVRFLLLEPATLSLNAPASDGTTPAELPHSATFSARVILTNGQDDPQGVSWSTTDPDLLSVNASGGVSVKPVSSRRSIVLTATAVRDNTQKAHAYVDITTDGILDLTVTPSDFTVTTLNVIRSSDQSFVLNQRLSDQTRIRLPAGTYDAQARRGGMSVDLPGLVITPNGIVLRGVAF